MFKLEIHERTAQDNLPAEILRELQVEELWARRAVLANRMNMERLNLYASRRALLWARQPRLRARASARCGVLRLSQLRERMLSNANPLKCGARSVFLGKLPGG